MAKRGYELSEARRVRRHRRVRRKVVGTAERPRLVVHRSNKNIQGHVVDDLSGRVLLGVSSMVDDLERFRGEDEGAWDKRARSRAAGLLLAERARAAGVNRVVFDRGGYLYHGRVAAFADGAREGGLEF
jgi:large subunit ribosomal protein L18